MLGEGEGRKRDDFDTSSGGDACTRKERAPDGMAPSGVGREELLIVRAGFGAGFDGANYPPCRCL